MVLEDLQLVSPNPDLSMTADEVPTLAVATRDAFDANG
jgi:hypothetical protein